MKIGFLNNQIDNRGTGNALFDYAHYNEEILGNQSIILTLDTQSRDKLMEQRLLKRFKYIYSVGEGLVGNVDVIYHIKSGADDGVRAIQQVRYAVHAVFDYAPHGDRYAVVSPWMGRRFNSPYVPHIVSLPETSVDLRNTLAIGQDDIVFGRYGGADSFDIPWAWSAINRALEASNKVVFLFMNTNQPDIEFYDKERVIFIDQTAIPEYKRAFINTCNAMLHARGRGETFGIAVGEFAICGVPVIAYGLSGEQNHYQDTMPRLYDNEQELFDLLTYKYWAREFTYGYEDYTPEKVMAKFKEVFLD